MNVQVFNNLHNQSQEALVQDWVMLSLSNFTQRTPVSMATWSLTCFFISASTNSWLRPLYPFIFDFMDFLFALGFFKTGFLLHTFEDFYSLVFVLTILNAFCNENVLNFGHSETEKKFTNFCYIMCLIHVHQIYRHIHASLTLCIENTEHLS